MIPAAEPPWLGCGVRSARWPPCVRVNSATRSGVAPSPAWRPIASCPPLRRCPPASVQGRTGSKSAASICSSPGWSSSSSWPVLVRGWSPASAQASAERPTGLGPHLVGTAALRPTHRAHYTGCIGSDSTSALLATCPGYERPRQLTWTPARPSSMTARAHAARALPTRKVRWLPPIAGGAILFAGGAGRLATINFDRRTPSPFSSVSGSQRTDAAAWKTRPRTGAAASIPGLGCAQRAWLCGQGEGRPQAAGARPLPSGFNSASAGSTCPAPPGSCRGSPWPVPGSCWGSDRFPVAPAARSSIDEPASSLST